MPLKEKIKADTIAALKAKNERALETLRGVSAALQRREKEKAGTTLTDEQVLEVIASEAKKRKEAIALFEQGGRQDLAAKERAELAILTEYLPAQLTDAELEAIVKDVIVATGATGAREFGKVMGAVMPQVKGKADGRRVSAAVKKLLG